MNRPLFGLESILPFFSAAVSMSDGIAATPNAQHINVS